MHDAAGAHVLTDTLISTYAEIYAAKAADPFFTVQRFADRFRVHTSRPGYSLATACWRGEFVGYAYGVPLSADTLWWSGLTEPLPAEQVHETGERTFALNEIMVRAPWRRRGIARRLHDALLAGRREERATLLVQGTNTAARTAYENWGWVQIGLLRPFADAPLYDAMMLDLTAWHPSHG
jgi:GNAT superfamily N-acetyltransferase